MRYYLAALASLLVLWQIAAYVMNKPYLPPFTDVAMRAASDHQNLLRNLASRPNRRRNDPGTGGGSGMRTRRQLAYGKNKRKPPQGPHTAHVPHPTRGVCCHRRGAPPPTYG
jgi:hypothetical protein